MVLCHHPTLCSLKISDIYCCWNTAANNLEIELWHSVEVFFINNDVSEADVTMLSPDEGDSPQMAG